MKIDLDHLDVVTNYLSTVIGFTKLEPDEGTAKKAYHYNDGLIVNLYYTKGTITFQGKNVSGEIANSIKQFITPYLKQ